MALSTCFRDNSLISIVGGDTHSIPSGKEILDAGAEGLPCRGGVFNVVRVDVIGIPNDADFSMFSESLLEDPVRTARYQKLIESASESGKMMRLANLTAASDKRSCGKVLLTIDGKTRVLQTVGELELLNKEDKVINLPSKSKDSLTKAIYNAQLNDPILGLVVKSAFGFFKEDKFNKYPAYSLRFLDMDKATAVLAYYASERKTTKKATTQTISAFFMPVKPAPKRSASDMTSSDNEWNA
jgi:hypothetical protein